MTPSKEGAQSIVLGVPPAPDLRFANDRRANWGSQHSPKHSWMCYNRTHGNRV